LNKNFKHVDADEYYKFSYHFGRSTFRNNSLEHTLNKFIRKKVEFNRIAFQGLKV
jgi:hypothetical protein